MLIRRLLKYFLKSTHAQFGILMWYSKHNQKEYGSMTQNVHGDCKIDTNSFLTQFVLQQHCRQSRVLLHHFHQGTKK